MFGTQSRAKLTSTGVRTAVHGDSIRRRDLDDLMSALELLFACPIRSCRIFSPTLCPRFMMLTLRKQCIRASMAALAVLLVMTRTAHAVARSADVGSLDETKAGAISDAFTVQGRADAVDQVEFGIAMRQHNLETLHELFTAVSTPGNPRYQRFLSRPDLMRLVGPTPREVRAVLSFLEAASLKVVEGGCYDVDGPAPWCDESLHVVCTAAQFEAAFRTTLYRVQDRQRGDMVAHKIIGTYHLPPAINSAVVTLIGPPHWTVASRQFHTRMAGIPTPSQDVVVPASLQAQYGIGGRHVSSKAVVGVAEFTSAGISKSDLSSFCSGASVEQVCRVQLASLAARCTQH